MRLAVLLLLAASATAKPAKATRGSLKDTPKVKRGGPITLMENCLADTNASLVVAPLQQAAPDTSDPIDVAFYDTRPRIDSSAFYLAAALCNSSGRVRFHALLKYPQPIAGFRVHALSPPGKAQCLYDGMKRLSHGPGPQYLYKPLLHLIMPPDVKRLILLDTDTVMLRDVSELYAEFAHFGTAVLGVGNEQSLLYQRGSGGKLEGKNGGVQLLNLEGMRSSPQYTAILDRVASGRDGRHIGYLGDQTLYTFLSADYPQLFHKLPCEWNRQLSMHFGFRDASVHACPRKCGILHANYGPLKCVAKQMQANPGCKSWKAFLDALSRPQDSAAAKAFSGCPRLAPSLRATFKRAALRFFPDCCTDELNARRAASVEATVVAGGMDRGNGGVARLKGKLKKVKDLQGKLVGAPSVMVQALGGR